MMTMMTLLHAAVWLVVLAASDVNAEGCDTKLTYYAPHGVFKENPTRNWASYSFKHGKPLYLWYLHGQDFFYTPFAILIRFRLEPTNIGNTYDILTTSNEDNRCKGDFSLEARIVGNVLTVTGSVGGDVNTIRATAQRQDSWFSDNTILIVFDKSQARFAAYHNGQAFDVHYDASNVIQGWVQRYGDNVRACDLKVGVFKGTVREISYWRDCSDETRMQAQGAAGK